MLRQLAHLTRPLPAAGDRACAIAVYASEADEHLAAADTGFEGVACVDDAARALVLLCDLWDRTRLASLRTWADGLADFVLYMQDRDGRFVNFVLDWSGRRNTFGLTSRAGGRFWQARGLRGLAKMWITFDDEPSRGGFERGLAQAVAAPAPP
ncbi:MAG: hypothetical protein ACRDF0_07250, partial [Candidatus Limnocylindria bacterium]